VTGRLLTSSRGLIVEVDDGGVWALDADHKARSLVGQRVTIEGVRSGFDSLNVEWLGAANLQATPSWRSPDNLLGSTPNTCKRHVVGFNKKRVPASARSWEMREAPRVL
jgi:hypothetical protein